jgi:hypothetical protein
MEVPMVKKYLHYHNVGTGAVMWSGAFASYGEHEEVTPEHINEFLNGSKARLASWDPIAARGVFVMGPLPGIVILSDFAEPVEVTTYKAAQIIGESAKYAWTPPETVNAG